MYKLFRLRSLVLSNNAKFELVFLGAFGLNLQIKKNWFWSLLDRLSPNLNPWALNTSEIPVKKSRVSEIKLLFFLGRSVPSDIFLILEIRPWFKIWTISKVNFCSICNILVNTWSAPKDFTTNAIWRYQKVTKKCIFSEIKNFLTLLNQNPVIFSMDNVFSNVWEIGEE